jgi:hypothetical protein
MNTRRRGRLALALLVAAGILAWGLNDLYGARRASLRDFDADEVARLETAMWRAYYDRREVALFRQMGELLRTQYRLPPLRSNAVAYRAARAAFVFKKGRSRADYERALPDLVRYYEAIRAVSDTPFDVQRAARLELEWWIVHRERGRTFTQDDLSRALAELQAAVYALPAERFSEHARLRGEAMTIRDERAQAGGVGEADWRCIEDLLRASYRDLSKQVKA